MAVFVDTTILIYSVSGNPVEAAKQRTAAEVLKGECVVSIQVLQEFFVQVTRPGRPHALPDALAEDFIATWMRFPVVDLTAAILRRALEVRRRYRFAYWDAAVVAAAEAGRCDEIATEDLSHGQKIGGITIVNPFLRR